MWSDLCRNWRRAGIGIPLAAQAGSLVFSHPIWAQNVILGTSSTDQLMAMAREMSVLLYSRDIHGNPTLFRICSV
eukprot:6996933-Pyramimonas_sp.AAC.1